MYYKNLPDKYPKLIPRKRFIRYYADLYALEHGDEITPISYMAGSQYTYAELGKEVLSQCQKDSVFDNLDLMVVCYWSHEFDPDDFCGAYFCDLYNIYGKSFDICDQGLLSPITALCIIKSYFEFSYIKNALLVCFDQTAIPIGKNFSGVLPNKTSSMAMLIEKFISKDAKFKINSVNVLTKSEKDQASVNKDSMIYTKYNCAEIFQPFFNNQFGELSKSKQFVLNVSDVASNDRGVISGEIL